MFDPLGLALFAAPANTSGERFQRILFAKDQKWLVRFTKQIIKIPRRSFRIDVTPVGKQRHLITVANYIVKSNTESGFEDIKQRTDLGNRKSAASKVRKNQ